jgi:hypothetical protein
VLAQQPQVAGLGRGLVGWLGDIIGQADTLAALERIGKELTPAVKAQLKGKDLARVRRAYATRLGQLKAEALPAAGINGKAGHEVPIVAETSP